MKRELGRRTDEAPEAETLREGVVAGRNAVLEAIKSAASIEKIYVARGEKQGSIVRIWRWHGRRTLSCRRLTA